MGRLQPGVAGRTLSSVVSVIIYNALNPDCSHQCVGICLLKLTLLFQFRQSLWNPATTKYLTLL